MKLRLILAVTLFVALLSGSLYAAPLTIGIVLSTGGLNDGSFNDAAYEGVMLLRKEGDRKSVV